MDTVFGFLAALPSPLVYTLLGIGSALENLVPPVPADTFVLLGGFLAGRGEVGAWTVFLVTWGCNVGSALAVYWIGHRYGRVFFEEGMGRHVLTEPQLRRMASFYERWGTPAIFLTRFLPGFRAVVPAFAGVSHQPFLPVAVPLVVASAIWYGALVWLGATTGRNLETILGWLAHTNRVLLAVAGVLAVLTVLWWHRSRRERSPGGGGGEPGDGRPRDSHEEEV